MLRAAGESPPCLIAPGRPQQACRPSATGRTRWAGRGRLFSLVRLLQSLSRSASCLLATQPGCQVRGKVDRGERMSRRAIRSSWSARHRSAALPCQAPSLLDFLLEQAADPVSRARSRGCRKLHRICKAEAPAAELRSLMKTRRRGGGGEACRADYAARALDESCLPSKLAQQLLSRPPSSSTSLACCEMRAFRRREARRREG